MEMAIRTEDVCKDDLLLPYGEVQKRWIWQGKACSNSTQLYVLWEMVKFLVNRSDFSRPKSMFVQYIFLLYFLCSVVVGLKDVVECVYRRMTSHSMHDRWATN